MKIFYYLQLTGIANIDTVRFHRERKGQRKKICQNFSLIMDESKNILLNKLQEGASFVKFNADGSLNEGFFYICPKLKSLCYNGSKRRFQNSTNECNYIHILLLFFCNLVFFVVDSSFKRL